MRFRRAQHRRHPSPWDEGRLIVIAHTVCPDELLPMPDCNDELTFTDFRR